MLEVSFNFVVSLLSDLKFKVFVFRVEALGLYYCNPSFLLDSERVHEPLDRKHWKVNLSLFTILTPTSFYTHLESKGDWVER